MRTIIAGSRSITDYKQLQKVMKEISWSPTVILSGHARGVDLLGERWARENNVELELYPADWDNDGKAAGFIRNKKMVDNAEAVVILWDGKSKGTNHTFNLAVKAGLQMWREIIERG